MVILGGGETIQGDGISVKVIRCGVTWNRGVTGQTIWMVKAEPGENFLLVLERLCSMAAKEWPPLEAPGWTPLDVPWTGCGPGWWTVDQGVAMI
jgi:hypothetical protein